jgi:hypothetical protein
MEKVKRIGLKEKAGSQDVVDAQKFAKASMDHLTLDGITGGYRCYTGFDVTQTSVTKVKVGNGRLFNVDGSVYFNDFQGGVELNFAPVLPAINTSIVTIVVSGGAESLAVPIDKEFLKDAVARTTEIINFATESWRQASIGQRVGNAAAQPTPLPADPTFLEVAYVTLSPTGIVSISPNTDNLVRSAREAYVASKEATTAVAAFQPQIQTLGGDIARVANAVAGKSDISFVNRIALDTARIKAREKIPSIYTDYDARYFLVDDETDASYPGYHARRLDGIRFPVVAFSEPKQLAVVNPGDTNFAFYDGLVIPAFDELRWREVRGNDGELALNVFNYVTGKGMTIANISPTRKVFGPEYIISASSAWWGTGRYTDQARGWFANNGAAYQVLPLNQYDANGIQLFQVSKAFTVTTTENYWTRATPGETEYGGYPWCQGFFCPQDMWVTSLGVAFSRLDTQGDVLYGICELNDDLSPNLDMVLNTVVVPHSQLMTDQDPRIAADVNKIRSKIRPTLLRSGKRYGVFVATAGNHWVRTTDGLQTDGTLFYQIASGLWIANPTQSMMIDLGIASFRNSRAELQLNTVALAGGITSLDLQANQAIPESATLTPQVLVGGAWLPLDPAANPFATKPDQISLKMVFSGSRAMHAGLELPNSRLTASRPDVNLREISPVNNLAAASTKLTRVLTLEGFDPAHHTITQKVIVGATTYLPTSQQQIPLAPGVYQSTANFTLPAGTTSMREDTLGTTDDVTNLFVISEADWVANA